MQHAAGGGTGLGERGDLIPKFLVESRKHWKAAADYGGGQLGQGPETHKRDVVSYVAGLCEAKGVVEPHDGGNADTCRK